MFVRRCEPRRRGSRGGLGLLVWKRSWAFGSSVVGCSAGVVRMRFWAPGSPPQALAWRDSMPIVPDGGLVPSGRRGGAWWLENWIVDASKTGFPFGSSFLLLISNRTLFFSVCFDRFVIILV